MEEAVDKIKVSRAPLQWRKGIKRDDALAAGATTFSFLATTSARARDLFTPAYPLVPVLIN